MDWFWIPLQKGQLSEIVLSLLLSLVSKLNGVMRTMVIAGKAGEAILMVQPDWIFAMSALDITYRTYVGTDAALHATVFLYVETLVGDEYILEETTYHLGEEPWDRAFDQSADAFLAVEDFLTDNGKFLCSILLLPDFTLLRIHIHERQTDVRFRHDERVGG